MRKTVTIDGQEIKLVSHGATPLLYKQEFGSDFFGDVLKLVKSMESLTKKDADEEESELNLTLITYEDIDHVDLMVFYRLMYILAKSGNKEIDDMVEWLSGFDEFPALDYIEVIFDLLNEQLSRKKKQTSKQNLKKSLQ